MPACPAPMPVAFHCGPCPWPLVVSVRGRRSDLCRPREDTVEQSPRRVPRFNVKVSYSGMVIGLQVGIVCAGFTPLLGTVLIGCREG